MNLTGDAISAEDAYAHGLVNRVVADHELFDAALAWARKLGRPGAGRRRADQARVDAAGLDEGIAAEKQGFATAFGVRGRAGGHRRVPREAPAPAGQGR